MGRFGPGSISVAGGRGSPAGGSTTLDRRLDRLRAAIGESGPTPLGGTDEKQRAQAARSYERRKAEAQAYGVPTEEPSPGLLSELLGPLDALRNAAAGAVTGLAGVDYEGDEASVGDPIAALRRAGIGLQSFAAADALLPGRGRNAEGTGYRQYGIGDLPGLKVDEDDGFLTRGAKKLAAFAGDTAIDPLTYVSLGTAALGRRGAAEAVEAVTRNRLLTGATRASDDVLESFARRSLPEDVVERAKGLAGHDEMAETALEGLDPRNLGINGLSGEAATIYLEGGSRGLNTWMRKTFGDDAGEELFRALPRDVQGGIRVRVPFKRQRIDILDESGNVAGQMKVPVSHRLSGDRSLLEAIGLDEAADRILNFRNRTGGAARLTAGRAMNSVRNKLRTSKLGSAIADNFSGVDGQLYGRMLADLSDEMRDNPARVTFAHYAAMKRDRTTARYLNRDLQNSTVQTVRAMEVTAQAAGADPEAAYASAERYFNLGPDALDELSNAFDPTTGEWDTDLLRQLDVDDVLGPDVSEEELAGLSIALMGHGFVNQMLRRAYTEAGVDIPELDDYIAHIWTTEERELRDLAEPNVAARPGGTPGAGTGGYDPRKRYEAYVDAWIVRGADGTPRLNYRRLSPAEANTKAGREVFRTDPRQVVVQYGEAVRKLTARVVFANELVRSGTVVRGSDEWLSFVKPRTMAEAGEELSDQLEAYQRILDLELLDQEMTVRQHKAIARDAREAVKWAREQAQLAEEDVEAAVAGRPGENLPEGLAIAYRALQDLDPHYDSVLADMERAATEKAARVQQERIATFAERALEASTDDPRFDVGGPWQGPTRPEDEYGPFPEEFFESAAPAFEGGPVLYHGTSAPIGDELLRTVEETGGGNQLYGPGYYTTGSSGIANDYTRKGAGRVPWEEPDPEQARHYTVEWTGRGQPNVLDMREPAHEALRDAIRRRIASDDAFLEEADPDAALALQTALMDPEATGEQVYDAARRVLATGGDSDGWAEASYLVNRDLSDQGFDALRHIGGQIVGQQDHDVYIWLRPEEVSIRRTRPAGPTRTEVHHPRGPMEARARQERLGRVRGANRVRQRVDNYADRVRETVRSLGMGENSGVFRYVYGEPLEAIRTGASTTRLLLRDSEADDVIDVLEELGFRHTGQQRLAPGEYDHFFDVPDARTFDRPGPTPEEGLPIQGPNLGEGGPLFGPRADEGAPIYGPQLDEGRPLVPREELDDLVQQVNIDFLNGPYGRSLMGNIAEGGEAQSIAGNRMGRNADQTFNFVRNNQLGRLLETGEAQVARPPGRPGDEQIGRAEQAGMGMQFLAGNDSQRLAIEAVHDFFERLVAARPDVFEAVDDGPNGVIYRRIDTEYRPDVEVLGVEPDTPRVLDEVALEEQGIIHGRWRPRDYFDETADDFYRRLEDELGEDDGWFDHISSFLESLGDEFNDHTLGQLADYPELRDRFLDAIRRGPMWEGSPIPPTQQASVMEALDDFADQFDSTLMRMPRVPGDADLPEVTPEEQIAEGMAQGIVDRLAERKAGRTPESVQAEADQGTRALEDFANASRPREAGPYHEWWGDTRPSERAWDAIQGAGDRLTDSVRQSGDLAQRMIQRARGPQLPQLRRLTSGDLSGELSAAIEAGDEQAARSLLREYEDARALAEGMERTPYRRRDVTVRSDDPVEEYLLKWTRGEGVPLLRDAYRSGAADPALQQAADLVRDSVENGAPLDYPLHRFVRDYAGQPDWAVDWSKVQPGEVVDLPLTSWTDNPDLRTLRDWSDKPAWRLEVRGARAADLGQMVDGLDAQGEFIVAGPVRVAEVDGNRIVLEQVPATPTPEAPVAREAATPETSARELRAQMMYEATVRSLAEGDEAFPLPGGATPVRARAVEMAREAGLEVEDTGVQMVARDPNGRAPALLEAQNTPERQAARQAAIDADNARKEAAQTRATSVEDFAKGLDKRMAGMHGSTRKRYEPAMRSALEDLAAGRQVEVPNSDAKWAQQVRADLREAGAERVDTVGGTPKSGMAQFAWPDKPATGSLPEAVEEVVEEAVEDVPTAIRPDAPHASPDHPSRQRYNVAIVACSDDKLKEAAKAGVMYLGDLHKKGLAWANRHADRVLILSSKYGLLDLEDLVQPYDLRPDSPNAITPQQLRDQAGNFKAKDLRDQTVAVVGGKQYRDLVESAFPGVAVNATDGARGIGDMKQMLAQTADLEPTATARYSAAGAPFEQRVAVKLDNARDAGRLGPLDPEGMSKAERAAFELAEEQGWTVTRGERWTAEPPATEAEAPARLPGSEPLGKPSMEAEAQRVFEGWQKRTEPWTLSSMERVRPITQRAAYLAEQAGFTVERGGHGTTITPPAKPVEREPLTNSWGMFNRPSAKRGDEEVRTATRRFEPGTPVEGVAEGDVIVTGGGPRTVPGRYVVEAVSDDSFMLRDVSGATRRNNSPWNVTREELADQHVLVASHDRPRTVVGEEYGDLGIPSEVEVSVPREVNVVRGKAHERYEGVVGFTDDGTAVGPLPEVVEGWPKKTPKQSVPGLQANPKVGKHIIAERADGTRWYTDSYIAVRIPTGKKPKAWQLLDEVEPGAYPSGFGNTESYGQAPNLEGIVGEPDLKKPVEVIAELGPLQGYDNVPSLLLGSPEAMHFVSGERFRDLMAVLGSDKSDLSGLELYVPKRPKPKRGKPASKVGDDMRPLVAVLDGETVGIIMPLRSEANDVHRRAYDRWKAARAGQDVPPPGIPEGTPVTRPGPEEGRRLPGGGAGDYHPSLPPERKPEPQPLPAEAEQTLQAAREPSLQSEEVWSVGAHPASYSGYKLHVSADSADEVEAVIRALHPTIQQRGLGWKVATDHMRQVRDTARKWHTEGRPTAKGRIYTPKETLDHLEQQASKGVTLYLPDRATMQRDIQEVLDALPEERVNARPVPGDEPLPKGVGWRYELRTDPGNNVDPTTYQQLYAGTAEKLLGPGVKQDMPPPWQPTQAARQRPTITFQQQGQGAAQAPQQAPQQVPEVWTPSPTRREEVAEAVQRGYRMGHQGSDTDQEWIADTLEKLDQGKAVTLKWNSRTPHAKETAIHMLRGHPQVEVVAFDNTKLYGKANSIQVRWRTEAPPPPPDLTGVAYIDAEGVLQPDPAFLPGVVPGDLDATRQAALDAEARWLAAVAERIPEERAAYMASRDRFVRPEDGSHAAYYRKPGSALSGTARRIPEAVGAEKLQSPAFGWKQRYDDWDRGAAGTPDAEPGAAVPPPAEPSAVRTDQPSAVADFAEDGSAGQGAAGAGTVPPEVPPAPPAPPPTGGGAAGPPPAEGPAWSSLLERLAAPEPPDTAAARQQAKALQAEGTRTAKREARAAQKTLRGAERTAEQEAASLEVAEQRMRDLTHQNAQVYASAEELLRHIQWAVNNPNDEDVLESVEGLMKGLLDQHSRFVNGLKDMTGHPDPQIQAQVKQMLREARSALNRQQKRMKKVLTGRYELTEATRFVRKELGLQASNVRLPAQLDNMLAPEVVRDMIDTHYGVRTGARATDVDEFARTVWSASLSLWKTWVTLGRGPGYHFRNLIGGLWNNFVGGVSADAHQVASRIMRTEYETSKEVVDGYVNAVMDKRGISRSAAEKIINRELVQGDIDRLLRERLDWYVADGVTAYDARQAYSRQLVGFDSRLVEGLSTAVEGEDSAAIVDFLSGRQDRRLAPWVEDADRPAWLRAMDKAANARWIRANGRVAQLSEDFLRMSGMVQGIRDYGLGADRAGEVAAMIPKALQFDYQDLSPVERKWMRGSLVPFYVWSRHNVPLQFRAALREPGKVNAAVRANEALAGWIGEDDDQEVIPDWMQEKLGIRTTWQPDGYPVVIGSELPITDLNKFGKSPTDPRLWQQLAGQVAPLAKMPLEAGLGVDLQTGAPYNPSGDLAPAYARILPMFDTWTDSEGNERMSPGVNRALMDLLPPLGVFERAIAPFAGIGAEHLRQRRTTSAISTLAPFAAVSTLTPSQETAELNARSQRLSRAIRRQPGANETIERARELLEGGWQPEAVRRYLEGSGVGG